MRFLRNNIDMTFLLVLLFLALPNFIFSQINYSFFVAGHTYGTPGTDSLGLYYPFEQKFQYIQNRPEIELGILTGDIVVISDSEHWDAVDNDINDLGLPVYFAFGNHDVANRSLVEQRYGETYYSFLNGNDLFIVLDPNIDNWNISNDQLLFLENTINENASVSNNIFVFFHQVLWWAEDNIFRDISLNSTQGRNDTINFWTNIEPLFNNLDNEVVMFAGDIGAGSWSSDIMYYNYENITLIASGMGEGVGDNFVVVNVSYNSISYDLVSLNTIDIEGMGGVEDFFNKINIKEKEGFVKISPSVSESIINIRSQVNIINYNLFDSYGKRVMNQQNIEKSSITIDISNLEQGVYILKLFLKNSLIITNKIIKQ